MRRIVAGPLRWIAKYAASAYTAGADIEDAIRLCRQFALRNIGSTICPWDSPCDLAEQVCASYKQALNWIKKEKLDCYLSIKPPSLEYDFRHLEVLAEIAGLYGIRLHFDSLAPDTAAASLSLLRKTLNVYPHIGFTLPSSWRRSLADAKEIIDLGIPVRLVKGQWPDPDAPDIDPNENFLHLVDIFAGQAVQVAIATHDIALARESLHRLRASGTKCELEQLYGLPLRIDSVAAPLNVPVRVYIPYGHAYLAYSLSAVKKRPIILAWLLKDFLEGSIKRAVHGA